jgi:hypothetical protein
VGSKLDSTCTAPHLILLEQLDDLSWVDELAMEIDGWVFVSAVHEQPAPAFFFAQVARVCLGVAVHVAFVQRKGLQQASFSLHRFKGRRHAPLKL